MTYEEAVHYIEQIPMHTKKTDLENTRYMLKLMGNPQENFLVVHVAGTNGKGSVCAMLSSICKESGRKTGMFTSPHLLTVRERIWIDGEPVTEEGFASVCDRMCQLTKKMQEHGYQHPAYFEFLFGMAMLAFAEAKVELVVLETGLGGRLDATNVIERPYVTVITSVSMDHMEYLGGTIEKIAKEKAGIIKEGVPIVYWGENPAVSAVIEEIATKKRAEMIKLTANDYKILKIGNKNIDFCAFCRYYENSIFTIPFSASYQVANAVLVLEAVAALNRCFTDAEQISSEAVREGIQKTVWPGRLEEVRQGIIVDGAHNEDGIRAFIDAVKAENREGEKILLFSAVKEKNYEKMVKLLSEGINWKHVILTEIHGGRRLDGGVLKQLFYKYAGIEAELYPDIQTALEAAEKKKKGTDILYCIGSLYLVGEIKGLVKAKEGNYD